MACLMCLLLGPQGPGPGARGSAPRAQGPGPMAHGPGPRAQGPGPRARGPWPGAQGHRAQGSGLRAQGPGHGPRPRAQGPSFFKTTYCARILIEGARFPPFGFDIAEISLEASKCLGGNREAKSISVFAIVIDLSFRYRSRKMTDKWASRECPDSVAGTCPTPLPKHARKPLA